MSKHNPREVGLAPRDSAKLEKLSSASPTGPFSFAYWRHEHFFKMNGGDTEMIDRVAFSHRGGILMNMILAPVTKQLLRAYFAYRHRRTRALFSYSHLFFESE